MLRKILLLALTLGIFLYGCGGKQKASEQADSQENDLFVEYNPGYFPENYHSIKTLKTIKASDARKYRNRTLKRDYFIAWNNNDAAEDAKSGGARRRLLRAARSAIGTPYEVGGTSPGGFDCSGLVCWAYGNVGVRLPRTAREQSVVGRRISDVSEMRAGDIVAFRHPRRGYHTGIYVGDGKFIHSPRRKTHVKINSLDDPYFSATFLGARRVSLTGREDLLAQAENRLSHSYSYESSMRRFKREESRSSHNASRDRYRYERSKKRDFAEYKSKNKRELAEYKSKKNRRNDRSTKEVALNTKKDKRSRDRVVERESKRDRDNHSAKLDLKRKHKLDKDDVKNRNKNALAKNERKSKHNQVTAYEGKREKKGKTEQKKRSSRKS